MMVPLEPSAKQPEGAEASPGSGTKFDPLLDSVTDAIASVDRDWRITYLNAVAERVAGRSRQELLGKELWTEAPGLADSPFGKALRHAAAGGTRVTLTDYYPPADAWFEGRAFPSPTGLLILVRDITDTRQAEVERLRLLAAERSAREDAERTTHRLARLQELSARLAAARSPEEVMSVAVERIMSAVGACMATMALPEEEGRAIRTVAYNGPSRRLAQDFLRLPVEAPLPVPVAWRTGEPEWFESPEALAARYPLLRSMIGELSSRALATLPMAVEGRVCGVLALGFSEPRPFTSDDREFLLVLARHCALAMERSRLLAEVEAQRARLEELVMRAPAVMSVTRGPEHRFVLCNPRHRQLMGGRDLAGLTAREALPELEDQGLFEVMDRVYATGEPFVGKEFPMRVGSRASDMPAEGFFDFVYQPLRDAQGRVEGIASFAFDVTDQVLARHTVEELLRDMARSEERFRAFLTSTSEIIWDMPPEGVFDSDQPGWRAFTGQTREELLGWGWLEAAHAEDREVVERAWREAVAARAPFLGEVRLRRHDGVYRHMQMRAVPVLEPDGEVREWVGIHRDITRQREVEAERERLMAESQAANRAKDEFLAVMSHELRTPLTAVLGWTQMMRSRKDDAVVRDKGLEVIERNARSLAQLIEDVLDVSRILTGKLTLHRRAVELVGVVQAAVEVVRPRAEQKGVVLGIEVGEVQGQVTGDPGRLQQVFWNLLANAVKFTPVGGRVEVRVERGEEEWRVRVKDSGQGIRAEAVPHLFERFWQADGSSTREHGGLGLGLAIVRHLVELHGGQVEAASEGLGKGATFTVRLPVPALLPEAERGAVSTEAAAPEARLEGVRVLLVEDAADARELLTLLLRERGAEVRAATSAREAMERLQETLPDVLVSDIGLPGEDGHMLLKRVREWAEARDEWIPAIALTAYAGAEDARRAYRAGFQVHMAKPLEAEALVQSIARLAIKPDPLSPSKPRAGPP